MESEISGKSRKELPTGNGGLVSRVMEKGTSYHSFCKRTKPLLPRCYRSCRRDSLLSRKSIRRQVTSAAGIAIENIVVRDENVARAG